MRLAPSPRDSIVRTPSTSAKRAVVKPSMSPLWRRPAALAHDGGEGGGGGRRRKRHDVADEIGGRPRRIANVELVAARAHLPCGRDTEREAGRRPADLLGRADGVGRGAELPSAACRRAHGRQRPCALSGRHDPNRGGRDGGTLARRPEDAPSHPDERSDRDRRRRDDRHNGERQPHPDRRHEDERVLLVAGCRLNPGDLEAIDPRPLEIEAHQREAHARPSRDGRMHQTRRSGTRAPVVRSTRRKPRLRKRLVKRGPSPCSTTGPATSNRSSCSGASGSRASSVPRAARRSAATASTSTATAITSAVASAGTVSDTSAASGTIPLVADASATGDSAPIGRYSERCHRAGGSASRADMERADRRLITLLGVAIFFEGYRAHS
jgi:hypothetical protein